MQRPPTNPPPPATTPAETPLPSAPPDAQRGHDAIPKRIAHFTLQEQLGQGGMGVVYRAQDERLGRAVAIKLVRATEVARDDQAQLRLEEEAQALAKLSHPNVVSVYEVGSLPDGQVYLVMEHIQGRTLREWQQGQPRRQALLSMYRDIAAGLWAAHQAGVLHRDFKPENVLLGEDGRPRIIDFGLARALPARPPGQVDAAPIQASSLAGTPGYMAPEQVLGGALDPRTDQFSFCVALYEALVGHRPYGTRAFLLPDPPQRPPKPTVALPRWLWQLLTRGLAPRAEDRYPSMAALWAELGRDRLRLPKALGLGLTLVAAVSGAAGLARRSTTAPCALATAELRGIWDEAQEQRLQAALARTPFGGVTKAVSTGLSRYAAEWLRAQQAACEATVVQHSQPPALLERRLSCLDGRRRALAAAVDVFLRAPAKAAAQSDDLLAGLPELALCADLNHLRSGLPSPPQAVQVAQVAALQRDLSRAAASLTISDLSGAEAALTQAAARADAMAYEPARAALWRHQGELLLRRGQAQAGVATLRRALSLATTSRDDELVLDLWVTLARMAGPEHQPRSEAEEWLRQSDAWVQRLSSPQDPRRSEIEHARGALAIAAGRNREAIAVFTRALAQAAANPAALGQRASLWQRRATAYAQLGQVRAAEADYRAALADVLARYGERHPQVMITRRALGVLLVERGADEAQRSAGRGLLAQALLAAQRDSGGDSVEVGHCEHALAQAESLRGDYAATAAHASRAAALFREHLGKAHRRYGEALGALAVARHFQRDYVGAQRAYQEALAILETNLGTEHQDVGLMQSNLGETLLALGDSRAAIERFESALRVLRRTLGESDGNLALPYKGLGLSYLAQGRLVQARPALTAALRLQGAPLEGEGPAAAGAVVDPQEVAETRWGLARVLGGLRVEPRLQRALAQQALAGYRALGPTFAGRAQEIQRWLTTCCKGT